MSIKSKVMQIFCNHTNQKCITILDGDYINNLNDGKRIRKSTWICERCGKLIYKPFIDSECSTAGWVDKKYLAK